MSSVLHFSLTSNVSAFHFEPEDLAPLGELHPGLELVHHARPADLRAVLPEVELLTTWVFKADWYSRAAKLRAVMTPAAGNDWANADPSGRVPIHYGSFHGEMMAESLLGLMLHFNRRVPALLENEAAKKWDRNRQYPSSMLRSQRVLLIGYGHVGRACARLLSAVGMEVVGCRRNPPAPKDKESGAQVCDLDALPAELSRADHVVLLLPGGEATAGFMDRQRLRGMKAGAHLYNFGRGTTISESDLLWALDQGILAGAGLDVTEPEPLPETSPLWQRPEIFINPHSSCVYEEYRALHIHQLSDWLTRYL